VFKWRFLLTVFISVAATAAVATLLNGRTVVDRVPTGSSSVANFALLSQDGRLIELYRQSLAKAIVLVSYAAGCPIVRKDLPALEALRSEFEAKGVRFFLLDAFANDTQDKLSGEAKKFNIHIPFLIDDSQEISRGLDITRTGEALVIDPATWKIIFRGPIDDRFTYSVEKTAAENHHLRTALTSFLDGKPIPETKIPALGCAIAYDWPKVDYHKNVAPILRQHCYKCHKPQGIPPTDLWTYESLRSWSQMVREVIRTEQMPPWEADDKYGPFINAIERLSPSEKKVIYAWMDSGFPEGRMLSSLTETSEKRRRIRKDLVFKMNQDLLIPASASEPWHYELLMGNVPEDLWISGYQMKYSNKFIVQHAALLIMKEPMDLSKNKFQPEFQQPDKIYNVLRMPAQTNRAAELIPGVAYKIPKGSFVYQEAHFGLTGKDEAENITTILQKYQGQEPPKELRLIEITAPINIPPNAESHWTEVTYHIAKDSTLLMLGAHMHLRGKTADLSMQKPGEKMRRIYHSRYVFKNRRVYMLEQPIFLPAGTVLKAEFEFDNSKSNPAKIDHDALVKWGQDAQTNEMAVMHVFVYSN
jgi:peroxiredoxin